MNFEPHELPNSCAECNYCFNSSAPDIPIWECGLESHGETEEYAACSVLVDKDGKPFDFRPDWCPLIEVPPHGRLGDLDALYEEISNGNKAYNGIEGYDGEYPNIGNVDDCLDAIKYADTVIEAEGENI